MQGKSSFRRGFFASFPIVLGYIPAGITFGLVATLSGWSKIETLLASMLVFAGASQFAMVSMASPFFSVVAIPLFLNLRHVVYSFFVAKKFRLQKPYVTAFGLTDEVFALSGKAKDERFLQGLEMGAYLSWVLGTAVGTFGGILLTPYKILISSFLFSLAPLFLVLLLPTLRGYGTLAALLGGTIAFLCHSLGYTSLGILLAGILSPMVVLKVKGGRKP